MFISHASEDKKLAKQITDALIRIGLRAWYDEYEIQIGDSIRAKVNDGLMTCDWGVLIFSHNFFAKTWPKQELAALAQLVQEGRLLPVFHGGLTVADLKTYDPLLIDIRGEDASKGVREIARFIANKVRGPQHPNDSGQTVFGGGTVRIVDLPYDRDQIISGFGSRTSWCRGSQSCSLGAELSLRSATRCTQPCSGMSTRTGLTSGPSGCATSPSCGVGSRRLASRCTFATSNTPSRTPSPFHFSRIFRRISAGAPVAER